VPEAITNPLYYYACHGQITDPGVAYSAVDLYSIVRFFMQNPPGGTWHL
jgi:hypothetical protein